MLTAFGMAVAAVTAGIAQPAASDHCQRAAPAAPAKKCHLLPNGAVLAPDASEAARLGALLLEGEARFQRHFGRPPPPYAVVQDAAPGEADALKGAGFVRTLSWLTPAQFEAAAVASLRRGAEAQASARGLSAEEARQLADQAEQGWLARNGGEARIEREADVVPHEAGHGWYIETFWRDKSVERAGHYGGPGPDWMDEVAAILMEGPTGTGDRRQQFEMIYRGAPPGGPLAQIRLADLLDVQRFLSQDHPARRLPGNMLGRQSGTTVTVQVLAGEEARAAGRDTTIFYLQGRMFADFLIDRTGNPAVFASIGEAFGRGQTMAAWLADQGPRHNLPTSLPELDRAWREWLAGRFGPPGGVAKAGGERG